MFTDKINDQEIETMINKFESERKSLLDKLGKKDLESSEEKIFSQMMTTINSIQSSMIKLRKLRGKIL